MKKILFVLILVVSYATVNAQINKNAILLGGHMNLNRQNFSYSSGGHTNSTGFISLSAGKAYKQNKVLGLGISYSNTTNSANRIDTSIGIRNSNQVGLNIFTRQYKPIRGNLYVFGHLDLGIHFATNKYANVPQNLKEKHRGISSGFTAGISYQLLPKLQVEINLPTILGIDYTVYEYTASPSNKNSTFSLNSSLPQFNLGSIGMGFRLIL